MGEPLLLRAARAIGASLLFWAVVFFALRILHRRERALRSPEIAPWREDALRAIPLAWLFAAREVLRAVIGRDPPLVLYAGAGSGIAVALWGALRFVRRG